MRFLIARIMLGAGLIKIRGDQCWRDCKYKIKNLYFFSFIIKLNFFASYLYGISL